MDSAGTVFGGSREMVPAGMSWITIPVTIITPLSEVDDMLFWVVKMILDDKEVCAEERKSISFGSQMCSVDTSNLPVVISTASVEIDAPLSLVAPATSTLHVMLVDSSDTPIVEDTVYGSSERLVPEGESALVVPVVIIRPLNQVVSPLFWRVWLQPEGEGENLCGEERVDVTVITVV